MAEPSSTDRMLRQISKTIDQIQSSHVAGPITISRLKMVNRKAASEQSQPRTPNMASFDPGCYEPIAAGWVMIPAKHLCTPETGFTPRAGKRGSPQRISARQYGLSVGANPRSCTLQMQRAVLSWVVDDQTRQRNLAISYVVVDVLGEQILTGLIYFHSLDSSIFLSTRR